MPAKPPIEPTEEMIDLVIVEHETQATYINCLRGHCKAKTSSEHCPECRAYIAASNRLQLLTGLKVWTPSGLADQEEPPPSLSPQGRADWHRQWALRCELIEQAKMKLGE